VQLGIVPLTETCYYNEHANFILTDNLRITVYINAKDIFGCNMFSVHRAENYFSEKLQNLIIRTGVSLMG
jgi:hypothetical protein